ncbi:MalM family protein [Hydrocarboniclastica marina]|uniref:MalM family protein n=1 Tax=Hydrocarboniclastica marina TaxID=2259620 RepID=UPI001561BA39|nr:MalM family protein [Hydrocarboniclastica marina]
MSASKRAFGAVTLACLLLATPAHADRYYTWVDEQGELRTTIVNEPKLRTGDKSPATSPDAPPGDESQPSQSRDLEDRPPAGAGLFGRPSDDPVFNLENFPDAEALEAAGYVREGDPQPFFTWTDATGTVLNSPFNPGKEKNLQREKEAVSLLDTAGATKFSEARTSRRAGALPAEAGPNAATVLGLQGDSPELVERFDAVCCEALRRGDIHQLDTDRGTSVRVDGSSPVFDFPTGRSPYRIVQLPEQANLVPLTIRSFIDGGVFLPTLVFLDADWRPIRVVTDIEFTYEPESWYRYGYLEASLPVESEAQERWLVVLSKSEDLRGEGLRASSTDASLPDKVRAAGSGEIELSLDSSVF